MSQTLAAPVRHPKGLNVLFATEMWERFNFYGMRAILTLFMVEALQFRESEASLFYGGFLGLCYLTPMLGGYLADNVLGNRNCILLGGATMALGQFLLFLSASFFATDIMLARNIMWVALGVIILGNGLFKPNISSMVGQLYPKGDMRLDSAFTIFYLGINIGALLGITICPLLGDVKDAAGVRDLSAFKWGFMAASAAMLLGTEIFYRFKDRFLRTPEGVDIGGKPDKAALAAQKENGGMNQRSLRIFIGLAIVFYILFNLVFGVNIIYSLIYSLGLGLAGMIISVSSLSMIERQRIIVLFIVAFFVIFFWACFEQAGSSLTFIADKQTDTRIFGWNMPPSMVQNFNSLFVIIFAVLFSWLWTFLAKRNMEPLSPVKQGIGLLLLAFGFWMIALQVRDLGIGAKIGVIWLILMYLFHTLGELCLSPIGLSLVSKLSPQRFSSLLMGVWFLSNASGYALAGSLGALLPPTGDKYEEASKVGIDLKAVLDGTITPSAEQLATLDQLKIATSYPKFAGFTIDSLYDFFMLFVIFPGAAGVVLLLLSPLLKKMMHGVR